MNSKITAPEWDGRLGSAENSDFMERSHSLLSYLSFLVLEIFALRRYESLKEYEFWENAKVENTHMGMIKR